MHVSAVAERGGREVVMLNILKALDRTRYQPLVLFLTDGPFVEEVLNAGIQTRVIEAGRIRELHKGTRAILQIRRLLHAERAALVHSHDSVAHIYGGLGACLAGVPAMFHLHGVPRLTLSRDGVVSGLSILVPTRQTIACSSYVADAFRAAWPLRRRPVVVLNGMFPFAGTGSRNVREEFGIASSAPLVLLAARLQRLKGVHIFLEAAAIVRRACADARFIVLGGTLFRLEPAYAEEIRVQAERLSLNGVVFFTGFRPDVSPFFATADVVALCSVVPEAFGMVLLEAMNLGKPVIAPDRGGPREIVQHGVTGLLVEPGRPDLLAEAILRLIGDPMLRARMGQAGCERARSEFHAEQMGAQIQCLYDELARGLSY